MDTIVIIAAGGLFYYMYTQHQKPAPSGKKKVSLDKPMLKQAVDPFPFKAAHQDQVRSLTTIHSATGQVHHSDEEYAMRKYEPLLHRPAVSKPLGYVIVNEV